MEASGCLVALPVFKTGGRRVASPAGSIPVRLRTDSALIRTDSALIRTDSALRRAAGWGGIGSRLRTRAVACLELTSCSPTPRLVAARELLGGALVKAAMARAQGAGSLRGHQPGDCRRCSGSLAAADRRLPDSGDQRDGRSRAHQISAVRRCRRPRVTQYGLLQAARTWSSIWRRASGAAAAQARLTLSRGLPRPDPQEGVRLWLDRVFAIKGSGTVVTGTLQARTVHVGDGLDERAAAAAERAGLLHRLPGNVVLAAGAADQAARILARLPQPFTAAEARQALGTTRRVVIPLLEWLDRERITRRLADSRRIMRKPASNGER